MDASKNTVIVTGINENIKTTDITYLFSRLGAIKAFKLTPENRVGIVTYLEPLAAEKAVQTFNGMDLKGCIITVQSAEQFDEKYPGDRSGNSVKLLPDGATDSAGKGRKSGWRWFEYFTGQNEQPGEDKLKASNNQVDKDGSMWFGLFRKQNKTSEEDTIIGQGISDKHDTNIGWHGKAGKGGKGGNGLFGFFKGQDGQPGEDGPGGKGGEGGKGGSGWFGIITENNKRSLTISAQNNVIKSNIGSSVTQRVATRVDNENGLASDNTSFKESSKVAILPTKRDNRGQKSSL